MTNRSTHDGCSTTAAASSSAPNYFAHLLPPAAGSSGRRHKTTDGPTTPAAWPRWHGRTATATSPCGTASGQAHRSTEHTNAGVGCTRHRSRSAHAMDRRDRTRNPATSCSTRTWVSGPVARACLDLGRRYVGIEIKERYCDIAVARHTAPGGARPCLSPDLIRCSSPNRSWCRSRPSSCPASRLPCRSSPWCSEKWNR